MRKQPTKLENRSSDDDYDDDVVYSPSKIANALIRREILETKRQ